MTPFPYLVAPGSAGFPRFVTPCIDASTAPDTRAGGGAPEMESRLSTLATYGIGVRTSLEVTTG